MQPLELLTQPALDGALNAAHITVSLPVENGTLPIGFSFEVRDPAGELIHLEAWSRGSFTSDLHALFTMAIAIRRVLQAASDGG